MLQRRRSCLGIFIHKNEGAIVAFGTLVIAFFTFTLWWSTKGMLAATNKTIRLAREEFVASHRPKLIVRGVSLEGEIELDKPFDVGFTVVNIGDTDATIHDLTAVIIFGNKNLKGIAKQLHSIEFTDPKLPKWGARAGRNHF